jgi:uncharacterized membrane protein
MRLSAYIVWPLVFIGQLLATALLSWHLMAQVDFAYPQGYKLLDFAPHNNVVKGFETTQPSEHWAIFSQICDAIQHNGEGLREIFFTLPNHSKVPFLHEAEIIHLQDVSHLVNHIYVLGLMGALLWLVGFSFAYRQQLAFPSLGKIFLGFGVGLAVITMAVLLLGATEVFYWFHTKIFPEGHQWFFYYEDSLMTTLMKAPDIFAFIAILLVLILCALWISSTLTMKRFIQHAQKKPQRKSAK